MIADYCMFDGQEVLQVLMYYGLKNIWKIPETYFLVFPHKGVAMELTHPVQSSEKPNHNPKNIIGVTLASQPLKDLGAIHLGRPAKIKIFRPPSPVCPGLTI